MASHLRKLLKATPKECVLACSLLHKKVTPEANKNLLRNLAPVPVDPYQQVAEDVKTFNQEILTKLNCSEELVNVISRYYFHTSGKQIRPTAMLLLARGLSNPAMRGSAVLAGQRTFAQVIEIIHTASLVHDDVIDKGETRRGQKAVHRIVGNRNAVLGGDYMISSASYLLSQLGDMRLMVLFSRIIENLGRGELIQSDVKNALNLSIEEMVITYTQKTFCKTASLIANGCQGVGQLWQESAAQPCYDFGKNLGLAFQYIDDVLDFVSDSNTLGKSGLNDMKEGLATGPVLFALPEHPELREVISREFQGEGDIEQGLAAARDTGLDRTRHLALLHLRKALDSLKMIPPDSHAMQALGSLARFIYERVK